MDLATRTVHPLGGFDLTAIGLVLVVVLGVVAIRRLRKAFGATKKPPHDGGWSDDERE